MPNSPIIVARDEARSTGIVETLIRRHNVPASAGDIPVDYVWSTGSVSFMGDNKTPSDLIASSKDGRLHEQISSIQAVGAIGFLFIEGRWSKDGLNVGEDNHTWTWEAFCDLLMSVQMEGIKITLSPDEGSTPRILAALYRWTEKPEHGSWHQPHRVLAPAEEYLDKDYRRQVGMVMSLPDCGPKTADKLMESYGLRRSLGITDDGLEEAKKLWLQTTGIGKKTVKRWEEFLDG